VAHTSRLRSELLSRRELTQLAEAQLARDEMNKYKGWPMCGKCLRPVRAYGVEEKSERISQFWARCRHEGRDVWDSRDVRKPFSPNAVSMLVFFCR
jgi:hypothetical protein